MLEHQLTWTERHADLARFIYARGHLDWDTPAGAELAARNRDLAAAFRQWMAPLVASRRDPPAADAADDGDRQRPGALDRPRSAGSPGIWTGR